MSSSLKVDVSIMPDFPTPPPHSDASSTTSSPSSSSSSTSSKARSTVADVATPPLVLSSAPSSCPFGPDYDQNGHKIKRPMNAFMVWAQMRRAEITAVSSKVHNSTISKALGIEWRQMSEADKQPYVEKAKELRDDLFREHPHYVYRPRKRKQRAAPYSPRPGAPAATTTTPPGTINTTACLPAASATSLLLAPPSSSGSPPPLAALLMPPAAGPDSDAAATLAQSQMPLLLHPAVLQQLQLAAVLQQQPPSPAAAPPPPTAAAMMNPLLLANLLNPLFTQMLTQFASSQ